MVAATLSLSTTGVPDVHKAAFWSNKLGQVFGPRDIVPLHGRTLEGQIECFTLSELRLSHIVGSCTRVAVTPATIAASLRPRPMRIVFQAAGHAYFEQEGRTLEIGPGDCIVYDDSRPYRLTNMTETVTDFVCIPKHLIGRRGFEPKNMRTQKFACDATTGAAHDFLKSLLKAAPSICEDAMDDFADALLSLLLLPFANKMSSGPGVSRGEPMRTRAKRYISVNLGDADLSVDGIANALGCTTRYLHRVFRDEGTTVARYLWQSRIDACRRAIEQPVNDARSITDLAFSFGFSSSAHFSRAFKQRFGFPPSDLRKVKSG